jgi:hypothetical protein
MRKNSQALSVVQPAALANYDAAVLAIAKAHRVDEVKSMADQAAALATYARQTKNHEAERMMMEIRVRAERRCGELIAAVKKTGQLTRGNKSKVHGADLTPKPMSLESIGLTKNDSSNFQKLAAIPTKIFEGRLAAVPVATAKAIIKPPKEAPVPHEPERPDGTPHMFKLLSALHKMIRRGDQREAVRAAWQLDKHFSYKHHAGGQLWSELRRVSVEDCSADPAAPLDVYVLWKMWEKQTESDSEGEPWRLFTVAAVLRLCGAPKSRKVDHACIWAGHQLDKVLAEMRGTTWPQAVPVCALESHKGPLKAAFIRGEKAALNPLGPPEDDEFEKAILVRVEEIEKLLEVKSRLSKLAENSARHREKHSA